MIINDYIINLLTVELWAHEHSYERLWPIYNFTVFNGSTEHPYTNPGAPVHIGKQLKELEYQQYKCIIKVFIYLNLSDR